MTNGEPLTNPPWFNDESPDLTQYFGLAALVSASVDKEDDPYNPVRYQAWNLGEELRQQLATAAQEAIAEVLDPDAALNVSIYHYQVGPAAEGPPTYLLTLWEQAQALAPHIGTVLDVVEAAGLIWVVMRKIDNWVSRKDVKGVYVSYILPPSALEALCAAHVRELYEPMLPLSGEAFPVSAPMVQYGFSAWEANLSCLVVVRAGQTQHCFVVDSSGKVHLHYKKSGSKIDWLPVPQLIPGDSSGPEGVRGSNR